MCVCVPAHVCVYLWGSSLAFLSVCLSVYISVPSVFLSVTLYRYLSAKSRHALMGAHKLEILLSKIENKQTHDIAIRKKVQLLSHEFLVFHPRLLLVLPRVRCFSAMLCSQRFQGGLNVDRFAFRPDLVLKCRDSACFLFLCLLF